MKDMYMVANLLDARTDLKLYMKIENGNGYVWAAKRKIWIESDTPMNYKMGFEGSYQEVSKEEMDKLTK